MVVEVCFYYLKKVLKISKSPQVYVKILTCNVSLNFELLLSTLKFWGT